MLVCYNVDAPTLASPIDPPKNTKEALNGPHAAEWHDAYRLDLEAKMHNETFVYVPRPTDGTKVIKTTVNHVHKHADRSNPLAITMRRAFQVSYLCRCACLHRADRRADSCRQL